ncbi:DNA primase [Patescibacteria group bacterium]|nr:DNA primase [Patescibacteria group bacterium]
MDQVEQIKNRINIVDLLREYIELKKAGANYKALCPFHSEKTPSLMVSEDKQIWHCFGCSEGGDIFGFIMRMENVDFPEALRLLAKRAGVVLKRQDPALTSQKTKLMDILEASASFYSAELYKSQSALAYLKNRELTDETIKQFRLGFSPDSWDSLLKFLKNKGLQERDIALAGLINQKDGGGFYDRFRGRIMFPIFNHYGNVVGFTARVLPQFDDGKMGKYINSPETIAYKKSQILFGLNFAKQEIKKEDAIVVVEGNMDVVALHQAGFKNVVATSGTALTNEQVNLLKRYSQNIIMSFDADAAGLQAALRGIDTALSYGLNVKVLEMPKNELGEPIAKDPDELIKKSPEFWKKAISRPKDYIQFIIDSCLPKYNFENSHDKDLFLNEVSDQITKIKSSIKKSDWIRKLSELADIDEKILREQILKKDKKQQEKIEVAPLLSEATKTGVDLKYISLLLSDVDKYSGVLKEISADMLKNKGIQEFYRHLILYYNDNRAFELNKFKDYLESVGKDHRILDKLFMLKDRDYSDYKEEDVELELKSLVLNLKKSYTKEQMQILEKEMMQAEKEGDKEKVGEIMEKFKRLK